MNELVNSVHPGKCGSNSTAIIFTLILQNTSLGTHEIALGRMPQNIIKENSILIQVMAWCCQATSRYLSQSWPRLCHHILSIGHNGLIHLPLDKMAANLADDTFMNEKLGIFIWISLKFVNKVPIYNKSAFVQVMVLRQTGDKPLSEPLLTHFIDAYMWH